MPSWIRQVFVTLEVDQGGYATWDADAYLKGALILHTLRYLLGVEVFSEMLRRWAYPDPATEGVTDGSQCRSVTTEQFQAHAEAHSGMDLGWFFDVYLRHAELPILVTQQTGEGLMLRWETPGDGPFPMPVEIQIGDELRQLDMAGGEAAVSIPAGVEPIVDPLNWILRQ